MMRNGPERSASRLSIGDVVAAVRRDYPDVTHSSLRFLEREGLLTTTRTPGGHRIYTPADVDRIRQIKTWQDQRLSLNQIRQRLARLDRLPPPEILATTFLEEAAEGHRSAAYDTVMAADEVGLSMPQLLGDVIRPAMYEAGRRWERGELTVAQEKELSELARDAITELTYRHTDVDATGPVIVAGCVEGEHHELGLRMICGLLRGHGYRVHYLGADVAPRFLAEAARFRQPDAILLSVKLDAHLHAVRDAIAALATAPRISPMPRVIVGGDPIRTHTGQVVEWGATPVVVGQIDDAIAEVMALVPLLRAREGRA